MYNLMCSLQSLFFLIFVKDPGLIIILLARDSEKRVRRERRNSIVKGVFCAVIILPCVNEVCRLQRFHEEGGQV